MNIENIPKLITKEDPYHIHKILGILSLGHFTFRYYNIKWGKQLKIKRKEGDEMMPSIDRVIP